MTNPFALDNTGIRRPATMTTVLSVAAGFVDAFVYLHVQAVFTANQSGNLILAGMAIGQGSLSAAVLPTLSVVAYVIGAAIGVAAFDEPGKGRRRFLGALALDIAVLVALAVAMHATGAVGDPNRRPDLLLYTLVALAAATIGLQTVALRSVRHVSVLTSASTGNVTTIGVALGRLGRRGGSAAEGVSVIVVAVLAYVVGAALGAAFGRIDAAGSLVLLVPAAMVAGSLVSQLRPRRPRP